MDMKAARHAFTRRAERVALAEADLALIGAIQGGLPLQPRPFAALAQQLGMTEEHVMARIAALQAQGVIKRMGLIVRHHELGYSANAMVVWNVPDREVAELGQCLSKFEFVSLCYRRPRRGRDWPYNLFSMIHGRDRDEVLGKVRQLVQCCGLEDIPRAVLFSVRRFKQRGARYRHAAERETVRP